jgi:hypothetical protein
LSNSSATRKTTILPSMRSCPPSSVERPSSIKGPVAISSDVRVMDNAEILDVHVPDSHPVPSIATTVRTSN